MFEGLKDNLLQFFISIGSPLVIISGILLLLANKHERILFTPKRTLYRQLIKIFMLSILATLLGSCLLTITASLFNNNKVITSNFDLFALFIIYLLIILITLSLTEKKDITYHWVYLEKYRYIPLLIHKVTFNNKLLLSSVTSPQDKLYQGFIIIEETTILLNEKIYFIGPKNRNPFYVNRPRKEDLLQAIEQNRPVTVREEGQ